MSRRKEAAESPSWRARLVALRYVPALLNLVWKTNRGMAIGIVALRLLRAFIPVTTLWVGKLIVDAVVIATRDRAAGLTKLWELVALEILVVLAGEALARGSSLVESLLGD